MLSTKKNHFKCKTIDRLKGKEWKNIYHMKINQKKVGVAVLAYNWVFFGMRNITKDKERHYIIFFSLKYTYIG